MQNPIVIIGPMPEEIAKLKENLTEINTIQQGEWIFYEGKLFDHEVVVVKSGIGKVYAAMTAQRVIDKYSPKAIVLTGVAGGLNHNLEIGDLFVGKDYMQHDVCGRGLGFERGRILYTDMKLFDADEKMFNILSNGTVHNKQIKHGRMLSGDQFFDKKEIASHNYLMTEMHGDCVEMEAGAIAQVCKVNGNVPFICLKTISDKADDNAAVDFAQFMPLVVDNTFDMIHYLFSKF